MAAPVLCMDDETRAFAVLAGSMVIDVSQAVPCECGRLFKRDGGVFTLLRCRECGNAQADWPNVGQIVERALRVLQGNVP